VRRTARIVLGALLTTAAAASPPPPAEGLDTTRLESIEETTEALANRMFDLSLEARAGDARLLDAYVADTVRLVVPEPAPATTPEWKWVQARAWSLPQVATASREDALRALQRLLDHWTELDDVRFKMKSTDVESATAVEAHFKCWLIGRNRQGQREWLRGTGELHAMRADDGGWRLDLLAFDAASSLLSVKDMFSEVSLAAGVARKDASLAERGNRGLVSHGAAAADVNLDGLVDVFAAGLHANALYLNRGDGTFEDVAVTARLAAMESPGVGPVFLDFDDDGDPDLFVSTVGRQALFENRVRPDGALRFRDVSARARVNVDAVAFSAVAGDVNRDGRTDVYVACYNDYGGVLPDSWDGATNGLPNLLFLNQGDGTFREAARELGVADARWSYAAAIADVDEDADLDVLVANDFGAATGVFVNDGGRFTDQARERGLGAPGYGMGVSLGDYDADGRLDLHVTKMSSNAGNRILGRFADTQLPSKSTLAMLAAGNSLYRNLGGGRFEDVTKAAGPFSASWAWGGGFLDVDCDGRLDLYTPNGFLSGSGLKDT
jgi:hypothetical protein